MYANTSWAQNFQLDLEEQFVNVDFSQPNEELCVFAGPRNNSEVLGVDVWYSSAWTNIKNLTVNQWNNVSVTTYLTSSNLTIRFHAQTEASDTACDNWQIDAVLLHVWSAGTSLTYSSQVSMTFTIAKQNTLVFPKQSNIPITFALNDIRNLALPKSSLLSFAFALASLRTWAIQKQPSIPIAFTVNTQRAWAFSRQGTMSLTYAISGFYSTLVLHFLSYFSEISLQFMTSQLKTMSFSVTSVIPLTFSLNSLESFLKILNFYGQITISFASNSLRSWAFSISSLIPLLFGLDSVATTGSIFTQLFIYGLIPLSFNVLSNFPLAEWVDAIQTEYFVVGAILAGVIVSGLGLGLFMVRRKNED
jgi:hypothetical protein